MTRILTACLLGSIAFAASAQNAPPAEVDDRAETQAQIEADQEAADTRLDSEAGVEADVDRNCLRYTGSRISVRTLDRKNKDCVLANGRVYSREDINRTGQTDIAEALRMLDPSIF